MVFQKKVKVEGAVSVVETAAGAVLPVGLPTLATPETGSAEAMLPLPIPVFLKVADGAKIPAAVVGMIANSGKQKNGLPCSAKGIGQTVYQVVRDDAPGSTPARLLAADLELR
jgi:hypothetical protein